jgi:hypothetical protein
MMNSDSGQKKKPVVANKAGAIMGLDPSALLPQDASSAAEKPTQWPGPKKSAHADRCPVPQEDRWEGALAPSPFREPAEFVSLEGVEATKEEVWSGALQSREDFSNINAPLMPFDPKELKAKIQEARSPEQSAPPVAAGDYNDLLGKGCEREDLMIGEECTLCIPLEDAEQPAPQVEAVAEPLPARPVFKAPHLHQPVAARPPEARPWATRLWFQIASGCVFFAAGAAFAHFVLPRLLALLP